MIKRWLLKKLGVVKAIREAEKYILWELAGVEMSSEASDCIVEIVKEAREQAIEAWNRRTTTKEDVFDIVIANTEKESD